MISFCQSNQNTDDTSSSDTRADYAHAHESVRTGTTDTIHYKTTHLDSIIYAATVQIKTEQQSN